MRERRKGVGTLPLPVISQGEFGKERKELFLPGNEQLSPCLSSNQQNLGGGRGGGSGKFAEIIHLVLFLHQIREKKIDICEGLSEKIPLDIGWG